MKSSDSDKNQFEDLKKTISKLSSDKIDLSNKIEEKDRDISEYLRISNMAIVDCSEDLRVMNSYGAVDVIFKEVEKSFERGVNLIRMVHKITKNFKEKFDDPNIDPDSQPDLEQAVTNFIMGTREERDFKIVGETEEGEIFLLLWKIKRNGKLFRNYFRIIPSNAVIESAQQHHAVQLKNKDTEVRELLNLMSDGICILDSKSRVSFMNEAGKKIYMSNAAEILKKANVEGKYFRELFVTEDADELNKRLNFNTTAITSREPVRYIKMTNGKEVEFAIHPQFDKGGMNVGLIVVSKVVQRNDMQSSNNSNIDHKKIAGTIKQLLEEKKVAKERIKELEINHKWFQKKLAEMNENTKIFHKTIKSLYSYLESVPLPISIIQLPTEKVEFVNKAFENYFNRQRSTVLNKIDSEIYDENTTELLRIKLNEIVETNIPNEIKAEKYDILQSIIVNENYNPIHLVRVMIIKEPI